MENLKGELVPFATKDGLILHGFLARPKTKCDKALLHVHGLYSTFYRSKYAMELGKAAVNNGFNFLTIEQRGSYAAFGIKRKKGRKTIGFQGGGAYEKFENCIYDIEGAIRLLGKFKIRKIYLEGHSTGCQKVTYYQYKKKDKRVKGIVLLAPADDFNFRKKDLGKKFNEAVRYARSHKKALMPSRYIKGIMTTKRFLSFSDQRFVEARLFNYDRQKLLEFSRIKEPVLAVFGSKEQYEIKPVKEYMKILKKNSNSRHFNSLIINGADHGFNGKENELADSVVKWLKDLI